MEKVFVDSENLFSIEYDEERAILTIEFRSGYIYEYYDVPRYVVDELLNASSKGKYAHKNIYDNYRQSRIG